MSDVLTTGGTVDPDTLKYYNERGHEWADREKDHEPNSKMKHVIDLMGQDPLILDLGCGSGRAITALALMGANRYIGVDASETMIAIARERFPGLDFRLGTMANLKLVIPELCDGFMCVAALMQTPRAFVPQTFASIRSVLRPGAVGFIGTPSGFNSGYITFESSNGRIPQGHQLLLEQWVRPELEHVLDKAGFEVHESTVNKDSHMLYCVVRAV